jgi:thymidylate synthase (FAD)
MTRPTSDHLELILGNEIPVLDRGFIRVIDYMGNDESIVQAARVSYGSGTKQLRQDAALINYLMKQNHSTPFEMCELKLHIKLPIFVARQWIRHRTASVNEYSARYSVLDREFYIPDSQHLCAQSTQNRQGRGDIVPIEYAETVKDLLRKDAEHVYTHYAWMLGGEESTDHPSIARELARMNLTLNYYTQWYWKCDLHNILKFIQLRNSHHAQYEIRCYAQTILNIVRSWVPITYDAFCEHKLNSINFSKKELEVLKKLFNGEHVSSENSNLSKRDFENLMRFFNI